MALIDDVKDALRISGNDLNTEVTDLINAAQADLKLAGVLSAKAMSTTDSLIKRAVVVYCKAHFGFDNAEAERFLNSFDMLKRHLLLSQEYTVSEV